MGNEEKHTVTSKYIIQASFTVEGVVEKPDVIGAIFGQTEGLFGPDLDLRELQRTGRIGRIEIELNSKKDKTYGFIVIPSSLDKTSTAVIAAAVESVEDRPRAGLRKPDPRSRKLRGYPGRRRYRSDLHGDRGALLAADLGDGLPGRARHHGLCPLVCFAPVRRAQIPAGHDYLRCIHRHAAHRSCPAAHPGPGV